MLVNNFEADEKLADHSQKSDFIGSELVDLDLCERCLLVRKRRKQTKLSLTASEVSSIA